MHTRMEWLMYYALQAELGVEIDIYKGGKTYDEWVGAQRQDFISLIVHGRNYVALVTEDQTQPIGLFGCVVNTLQVPTATAVALLIAVTCDDNDQRRMFRDLASYLIRRAVCGLGKNAYKPIFLSLLNALRTHGCTPVVLETHLTSLHGEAAAWPGDERFRLSLQQGMHDNSSVRELSQLLQAWPRPSPALSAPQPSRTTRRRKASRHAPAERPLQ